MGNGCFSRPNHSNSVSDTCSPTHAPDSGISDGKAVWEERLVKLIGLDPTSVLREYARKTASIHVHDPSDPAATSDDDPGKIVRKTVAQLAKLCNETHTYGQRFADVWDQHRDGEMEDCANGAVPGESISRIPKLFKMACLKSGMVKLKTDSGVANTLGDNDIMVPSQCNVCSATFHLMQFASQDVLSYGEGFLSRIMSLPGVSIYDTTDWKVEISLADIDVHALQGSKQTEEGSETAAPASDHGSPNSKRKAIMIRHEKTSVFQGEDQDQNQAPEFQLTWEITMYIDQEVLGQNYAAFQSLGAGSEPEQEPKSPSKDHLVIHSLPSPSEEDGARGAKDGNSTAAGDADADAGSEPQHDAPADPQNDAPAEDQQAQEKEADEPQSIPVAPSPPAKHTKENLKRDGITTQQQEDMIRKELIHCDAKIIKVVMAKPSRTLTGEASKCKKMKQELTSILKKCYHVEPVIVEKLELGDDTQTE
ncbi:unnamed protein product [Phytomonas sp. EM1]|nr:unnamed protein product [Phytomonas sp. EM1]|eukprot:CCW65130.1 unnamed protein product [Phytomonas sp. isolate EM1]